MICKATDASDTLPFKGYFRPRFIYVERSVEAEPMVRAILERFPDALVYEIEDHRSLKTSEVPLRGFSREAKRQVLILARTTGAFIRPFQGGRSGRGAPPQFFIAHANGCPFDCQYCFLQAYLPHSVPVVFANQDELFEELARHIQAAEPGTWYHAGELSDALALEPVSGFASRAISVFGRSPHVTLELRTKCSGVASVVPAEPPPNIVITWTLTPKEVARSLEHGAACIEERLASAVRCKHIGYRVGFRLDPLIRCEGWERRYSEVIESVFAALEPHQIDSIVLGAFRYSPALATMIKERFPGSPLLLDEFVLCADGKFRYFRPLRRALYRSVVREIRRFSPSVPVALCMETEEMEQEVFGGEGSARGCTARQAEVGSSPACGTARVPVS